MNLSEWNLQFRYLPSFEQLYIQLANFRIVTCAQGFYGCVWDVLWCVILISQRCWLFILYAFSRWLYHWTALLLWIYVFDTSLTHKLLRSLGRWNNNIRQTCLNHEIVLHMCFSNGPSGWLFRCMNIFIDKHRVHYLPKINSCRALLIKLLTIFWSVVHLYLLRS